MILISAAFMGVGLTIILFSSQNLSSGPLTSPVPSPGYERNLSYTEVGFLGRLMFAMGVLLAFISIGIRKWSRYQVREKNIDGVKAVGISVATTNYDKDRGVIHKVMQSAELVANAKNEFAMDEPEYRMGWYFFVLHVTPNIMGRVIEQISTRQTMQNIKLEDRFIKWLSSQLEEKKCDVYLDLESRKGSSKYGLF